MKPPIISTLWKFVLVPLAMVGAFISAITKDGPNYFVLALNCWIGFGVKSVTWQ